MRVARLLLISLCACSGGLSPTSRSLSASDSLPAESRAVLDETTLPVLLFPTRYAGLTHASAGEHFFSLNVQTERMTLILQGTDVVHATLPEGAQVPAPRETVRGIPARTTVNEGIRSVTWGEVGAEYSLEVECHEDPLVDSRCATPGFALDLAEELVAYEARP
ncbi:MAG: hypothetical protein AB8H86_20690 [Polyangiales bacterium]